MQVYGNFSLLTAGVQFKRDNKNRLKDHHQRQDVS
jgi:hypothetical protein